MSEAQNGGNAMERLTYWNEEYGCWSYHCGSGEAANRLADYEDTERTPEEIDMDHEAAEQLRHLCRDYDLDRLEKLAEADKDGRVVVLPCQSGEHVFTLLDGQKHWRR